MASHLQVQYNFPPALLIAAGDDRFDERRGLGISTISFKVVPQDSSGIFIIENSFRANPDKTHMHGTENHPPVHILLRRAGYLLALTLR